MSVLLNITIGFDRSSGNANVFVSESSAQRCFLSSVLFFHRFRNSFQVVLKQSLSLQIFSIQLVLKTLHWE